MAKIADLFVDVVPHLSSHAIVAMMKGSKAPFEVMGVDMARNLAKGITTGAAAATPAMTATGAKMAESVAKGANAGVPAMAAAGRRAGAAYAGGMSAAAAGAVLPVGKAVPVAAPAGGVAKSATAATAALRKMGPLAVLAIGAIGVASIKMAGDFQQSTNILVTSAGESVKNLAIIRSGILNISKETGTKTKDLVDGMYQVEKAGIRGADGLMVLRAAAQAAREEGADLSTVTNATTSVMAAYGMKAKDSVMITNQLKTAAGSAKTTMEAYSGSLSNIIPIAAANKVSFNEIAGSISTLTQTGTTAKRATQGLAFAVRNLSAPNDVAAKTMGQLGISATDVASKLGNGPGGRGLSGTIEYLSQTLLSKMGPGGLVLIDAMRKSKDASKDLNLMMSKMDPEVRKVAEAFRSGKMSVGEYTEKMSAMGPQGAAMAGQFGSLLKKSLSFSDQLRKGGPMATTYTEQMKKMMGGAKGLDVALQLAGPNFDETQKRIAAIAKSAEHAGKNVEGWESAAGTFNVQFDRFKALITATAIEIGMKLLPPATKFFKFLSDNTWIILSLGVAIGTILVAATVAWTVALLANPVVQITIGIMALIAAVIYAYKNFETFRGIIDRAWARLKEGIQNFVDIYNAMTTFGDAVKRLITLIGTEFVKGWNDAIKAVQDFWKSTKKAFSDGWAAVTGTVSGWWNSFTSTIVGWTNAIGGFFSGMWNAAYATVVAWGTNTINFIKEHWRLILVVMTAGIGLIYVIIQDNWGKIVKVFSDAWRTISDASRSAWGIFTQIFAAGWNAASKPVIDGWNSMTKWIDQKWESLKTTSKNAWSVLTQIFMAGWNAVAKPVSEGWNAMTAFIDRGWESIKANARSAWAVFSQIFSAAWNGVTKVVSDGWNSITGFFSRGGKQVTGVSNDVKMTVTDNFNILKDGVVKTFNDMVNGVKSAWEKIKDVVSVPIRWIVENPYNKGIVPMWNAIAGVLHEDGLKLKEHHFANGGVIPGSHNRDDVPIYATPGEVVVPKSVVNSFGGGPKLMKSLGFDGKGGTAHFADGGIVGGMKRGLGAVKDRIANPSMILGDVQNLIRGAVGSVAGPAMRGIYKLSDAALKPMGGMGHLMGVGVHQIGDAVLNWVKGRDDQQNKANGNYGGPAGPPGPMVERWRDTVVRALGMNGLGPDYANGVLSLIKAESGGNPNAVNNWDSNAKAGHPSGGLMQTIAGTFAANRHPSLANSMFDPLANVYAGIHYAQARYGPQMLMAGGRKDAGGGYIGYDSGGWLEAGETMARNKTGKPEAVMTAPQWSVLERMISHMEKTGGAPQSGPFIGQATIRETVDMDLLVQRFEQMTRSRMV